METKVNYALVGGFVLVLGAGLIAGVLWIASGGGSRKEYDLYLALAEESVAGLNLNAPVKYRGVDVGKVRDIQLDQAKPGQVRLTFAIEHDTPIKEDTEAMLKSQGLTGLAYVELDGGSLASKRLRAIAPEKYPVIRTKPSLSARLENILSTALTKLDSASNNITKLLSDDNIARLNSTLADLAAVARTITERKDSIDTALASAARTFDNSARATEQLGPILERIGRGADAVQKLGDAAAQASSNAGSTIDSVGGDLKRFTSDGLPKLQNLIGEMNVLAASLRSLIEETERNPRGLIFGREPVPDGPGEGPKK